MASSRYLLYQGLMLPNLAHSHASLHFAHNFNVKDSDLFIVTYPKSGTTWMQEIIPLVLNGGDVTPIHTIPNWDRVPWLEETRTEVVLDKLTTPRAFVTHLPYHLMPASLSTSRAKVIYVTRNPKDVMVSSFYFHQMASFLDDPGTFEEFMDKFLEGQVLFGKWTDHVKSWRNENLGDRILYITYEEMVQGLPNAVRRFSEFLGVNLTEQQIINISQQCSFSTMKTNSMSNYSLVPEDIMDASQSPFLRKGVVGDWRNHFSGDQERRFSATIRREMGVNYFLYWEDGEKEAEKGGCKEGEKKVARN